jgi:two-component system, OmpR family, sensor histidine kinase KdpD
MEPSGGRAGRTHDGPGALRVHLGAAPGVGTTYALLDEAIRRAERGGRVLVVAIATHGRPRTAELLDRVRRRTQVVDDVDAADAVIEQLSTGGELPDVVCIDDASSDAVRSFVERTRRRGIDVVTSLSARHLDGLGDAVRRITGSTPDEIVPDEFLADAQIELVDVTPEAIRRRVSHGNVVPDDADPSATDLFETEAFASLRALLVSWMADRLATGPADPREARERVVVAVTASEASIDVVRRAARLAQRSRARLVAIHVVDPARHNTAAPPPHADLVRESGGSYQVVAGSDVASTLVETADAVGATQLVLGATGRRTIPRFAPSVIDRAVRLAGSLDRPIDVHVVAHHDTPPAGPRSRFAIDGAVWRGLLLAAVLLAVLTAVLIAERDSVSLAGAMTLYLAAVVVVSITGGRIPGIVTAIAAPGIANWFLVEPYHTFRIGELDDIVVLAGFVAVAVLVSAVVANAARATGEARRARRDAATLAELGGAGSAEPLGAIADHVRRSFDLDGVGVLRPDGDGGFEVVAAAGTGAPRDLRDATFHDDIGHGLVLAATGRALTTDDHRVLRVFLARLARAVDEQQLVRDAARAEVLAQADELKSSMLRAVSHDLRRPLAGIKAAVSSLRDDDVPWTDIERAQLLAAIEDDTDRLTSIVTNLLELGRIQAGAVHARIEPIACDDVVAIALDSIGPDADAVEVDLPDDLPPIAADGALLERVVANLVTNALAWSPPDRPVRITAHRTDDRVHLDVIDHGPGIHPRDRARVLRPFHRQGDDDAKPGLGLGLAIASGLSEAMDARLELRDTPRGGLTAVVTLPLAPPAEHADDGVVR